MIKRDISHKIRELSDKYPVIILTGPRQSGKTTLVKKIFTKSDYVNLENPENLEIAKTDPKGFLERYKGQVIIDEVQRYPQLLSYIQVEVDRNKMPAQYILTGSQNFQLTQVISQSLAGRAAYFNLLPLTFSELQASRIHYKNYLDQIINGFYPGKYDKKIKAQDFYQDYLATYIERDVRSIKNIGNLTNFQRFLRLLAGRIGQILNLSSLASDLGVSYKTIDSWISVLEASFIVFRLEPFYKNFSKRIIKSPKIYFYDTGLAAYLLKINTRDALESFHSQGALFENLAICELLKYIFNKRSSSSLYFWRDNTGYEVDCLIDTGISPGLVEIKSAKTFNKDFLKNISIIKKISNDKRIKSFIIYNGKGSRTVQNTKLIPWSQISKLKKVI